MMLESIRASFLNNAKKSRGKRDETRSHEHAMFYAGEAKAWSIAAMMIKKEINRAAEKTQP